MTLQDWHEKNLWRNAYDKLLTTQNLPLRKRGNVDGNDT